MTLLATAATATASTTAAALGNIRIAKTPPPHQASAYAFVERILAQVERLVPKRTLTTYAPAITGLALQMQRQQNAEDREWLEKLDLPDDVKCALQGRFIERGSCWLEFTERLAGYEGDYRELRSAV